MGIIIFGTNEIAQLAKFYLERDSEFAPVAFCLDGRYLTAAQEDGLPVIALEEISQFSPYDHSFFVPLYDNKLRKQKADQVKSLGYNLISYVSSKATCWSEVGENCFVMENNVIQPYVKVGDNVVFWSGNHIGHHSVIGNNVFFSSHVVLSGKCTVEDFCWFGVNSTVRDGLTISEGSLIGMGAVVTKNTKPYAKYKGNPAHEFE